MKNKKNIWHLIWIVGVYTILVAILLLIIEYKVKWENRDLNTYLYFYDCSGSVCTTTETQNDFYGRVKCDDKKCPYIKEKYQNIVVLADNNHEFLYDYNANKIIDELYQEYTIKNDYVIVKDINNKYGVIDLNANVIIEPTYNKIVDYKNGFLAYAENGKVGVINEENSVNILPAYEDIKIVDNIKYIYLEDGKYYIASYDTELPVNNFAYDYIYAIDNVILTIKDKKIDIITTDLESKLLLKIDTQYTYEVEKERASLRIYKEGNLLHFSVVNSVGTTDYIFDLKNKKLFY